MENDNAYFDGVAFTVAAIFFFLLSAVAADVVIRELYLPEYNNAAEAADGAVCLEDNSDLLYEGWTRSEVIRFCKVGR